MQIQGFIYGENNTAIRATVMLFDPVSKTSQVIDILPGEAYTIDGDESGIAGMMITFSATGYANLVTTVADLLTYGGNIHLEKSNSAVLPIVLTVAALAMVKNKKTVGATTNDIMPVILVGGVVFGIHLLSRLFDKLGFGGDPTTGEQSNPDSPWKPSYWRQYSAFTYAINREQAEQYAATIHGAFTIFQDDYNAIMSVFSDLRTKSNVSYLSDVFAQVYSEDLLGFLGNGGGILPWDGLSKDHLQTILSYVNKLPTN